MKIKTIEEIEDDIKSISRKRDISIVEAQKYQDQLLLLIDQLHELKPDYVKVDCFRCGTTGIIQTDDGKKHICDLCAGKEYTWMKLYDKNKMS